MTDAEKRPSIEVVREQWQRQLMADPEITLAYLKVAIAIGIHLNRKERGWAWPGIQRIATIAHVHPRTVMRATAYLSDMGHMEVEKKRKGKRNFANRYRPILKRATASRSGTTAMSLGSGKAVSLGSGVAMSPEPLTEPLTQHRIPINISASTGVDALVTNEQVENEESGIRERKGSEAVEKPAATPVRPETARAECYRLAGDYDGVRGRALVTKALEEGADGQEVLDEIRATVDAGGDLGHTLSYFWEHLWG
jgi:hypothetical protein